MKKLFLLLSILALPAILLAQVSFVAASGTTASYAGGTMTANFLAPAGSAQLPYLNLHFPFSVSSPINGSGAWSMSLADNSTMSPAPAGSQWRMQMCSAPTPTAGPFCFQVILPVTCVNNVNCSGSALNMSSSFAGAPNPPSGGGGSSVTLENVYASPGAFTFDHALNALFPQVTCYTRVGGSYGPATWTASPIDANDTSIAVPSAGDYICAFSSTNGLAAGFTVAVSPTSQTFEPTMTGTQHPTFTVNQTGVGGYSGTATYSTSGLASGMTGVFSPTTITGAGSNTLTLSFPFSQTPATTAFSATGNDGTNSHSANPSLTVGTINSGLVECWPMTDGSGVSFADACGTSNTETTTAGTLTWGTNTGLPGTTPTFSGTTYTSGANQTATNFTGATPFSVSSWVNNPGTTAALQTVASTLNPASNFAGWETLIQAASGSWMPGFSLISNVTGNIIAVNGTTTVSGSGTHYIVWTYDGSKTAAGVKMYVDGAIQSVTVVDDTLTGSAANTKPVSIGARTDGTDPFFGVIAYTRIYNRVLSQTDVTNYFAAGAR
jgi:hypothetical protein